MPSASVVPPLACNRTPASRSAPGEAVADGTSRPKASSRKNSLMPASSVAVRRRSKRDWISTSLFSSTRIVTMSWTCTTRGSGRAMWVKEACSIVRGRRGPPGRITSVITGGAAGEASGGSG